MDPIFAECVAAALRAIVQEWDGRQPVSTAASMLYKRIVGAQALVKEAGGLKAFCESCSGLRFVDAEDAGTPTAEIRLEQAELPSKAPLKPASATARQPALCPCLSRKDNLCKGVAGKILWYNETKGFGFIRTERHGDIWKKLYKKVFVNMDVLRYLQY